MLGVGLSARQSISSPATSTIHGTVLRPRRAHRDEMGSSTGRSLHPSPSTARKQSSVQLKYGRGCGLRSHQRLLRTTGVGKTMLLPVSHQDPGCHELYSSPACLRHSLLVRQHPAPDDHGYPTWLPENPPSWRFRRITTGEARWRYE